MVGGGGANYAQEGILCFQGVFTGGDCQDLGWDPAPQRAEGSQGAVMGPVAGAVVEDFWGPRGTEMGEKFSRGECRRDYPLEGGAG
jgi:hypothetical protein